MVASVENLRRVLARKLFKKITNKLEKGINQSHDGSVKRASPHSLENQSGIVGGSSFCFKKSNQKEAKVNKKLTERAARLIGRRASKTLINLDIFCLGKEIIVASQQLVQFREARRRVLYQDISWVFIFNRRKHLFLKVAVTGYVKGSNVF